MSWNKLISSIWKEHIADLGACFDSFGAYHFVGIPKFNALVSGATSSGQEWIFMRRPGKGFDGSSMLMKLSDVFIHSGFPNKYQVVISTRGQKVVIRRPFKTTYFLFMTFKSISYSLGPDVPNQNFTVFGASGDQITITVHIDAPNPSQMLLIPMTLNFLFNIDHSHPSSLLPHQKPLTPLDTTYVTLNKFLGFITFCRPDVGCVIQDYTDHVLLAPVQKICVKVVF